MFSSIFESTLDAELCIPVEVVPVTGTQARLELAQGTGYKQEE